MLLMLPMLPADGGKDGAEKIDRAAKSEQPPERQHFFCFDFIARMLATVAKQINPPIEGSAYLAYRIRKLFILLLY